MGKTIEKTTLRMRHQNHLHDEAVADKINIQLQDLNQQILESTKRKKESIAKIAKDVRKKSIIVENSQNVK